MLLPLPLLLPLLLTTTLATHSHDAYPLTTALAANIHDPSPLTTSRGTNTHPLHPFFKPNPCAFDAKYKDQTCVPVACYADGGRCRLSTRNRCAEHQFLDGELIQRTWLYSSAPRSCRPCKCVKAYAVGG